MANAKDYLIALDDGHGISTSGKRTPHIPSLGRHIKENEFNKPVVNLLEKELKRCGFRTIQLAPTDEDTPLTTRTNTANSAKANLLMSIHFNAMGITFGYSYAKGFSVHIQPEDKENPKSGSLKFAKLAIEELAKGTAQTNRGVVGQNLHMTRVSNMPAVLVECGFMDEEREALLMINPTFQREVAYELAIAVCRYFDAVYVPEKAPVKPVATPIAKPKEEEKLLKIGILVGSHIDLPSAYSVATSKDAPILIGYKASHGEVAKELIIIGGGKVGLKADKITDLSGKDRFETSRNVEKYLG